MKTAPSTKPVWQKLQIKPGRKVMFVNKPQGYDKLLGKLPAEVDVADSGKEFDVIQLFITSKKELERDLPKLKKAVDEKGMIWVTYPKLSSAKKSDINRDTIAEYAETLGLEGVAIVAIDDDWSALRLKVVD